MIFPLIGLGEFNHSEWNRLLKEHVVSIRGGQVTQVDYDGFLSYSMDAGGAQAGFGFSFYLTGWKFFLKTTTNQINYGAMAGAVGGIGGFAGGKAKTIKNPQSRKFFGKVMKYGIAAAGIGAAYRKVRKYQVKVEEDKNER